MFSRTEAEYQRAVDRADNAEAELGKTKAVIEALQREILSIKAPRATSNKPLNAMLELDDGRKVVIRYGGAKTMVCRQIAPGPALTKGEEVLTKPGKDGRKAVLKVAKRTKKDVHFDILGARDA